MSIGVVLTIIFAVLKLTGFVTWTWPGVFVPLFIELAFDAVLVAVLFLVGFFAVGKIRK